MSESQVGVIFVDVDWSPSGGGLSGLLSRLLQAGRPGYELSQGRSKSVGQHQTWDHVLYHRQLHLRQRHLLANLPLISPNLDTTVDNCTLKRKENSCDISELKIFKARLKGLKQNEVTFKDSNTLKIECEHNLFTYLFQEQYTLCSSFLLFLAYLVCLAGLVLAGQPRHELGQGCSKSVERP